MNPHRIPFITQHYTVRHTYGNAYVVKHAGAVVATFTGNTLQEAFNQAAERAYQLNRGRLLN